MAEANSKGDLRAIVAALHDAVLLFTQDGALQYANPAATTLHGVGEMSDLGVDAHAYARRFSAYAEGGAPLPLEAHPALRALSGERFTGESFRVGPAGGEAEWFLEAHSLGLTEGACALILNDITDEADAERRFEQTFEANPAPAVISRHADLRFIKVNQGFLEMTGLHKDEVIGKTVYDLDLLAGASDRELALTRFRSNQVVPQMEARLKVKAGGDKLVVVAGQPLEVADEPCMLFSFIDLERWEVSQTALKHSEERFAKAFKLAPVAATLSVGGKLIDVNATFEAMSEYHASEVIGKDVRALRLWSEDLPKVEESCRNLERKLRTKSGAVLDTLLFAETIPLNGEPCVLSMFHDITLRKQTESELLAAIDAVMQDASWFGRSVVERLLRARGGATEGGPSEGLSDLTVRERQVLELMCAGSKNEQIASSLGLSKNTVRNYAANLYSKLGVKTRADVIIWARERGITGSAKEPLLVLPSRLS